MENLYSAVIDLPFSRIALFADSRLKRLVFVGKDTPLLTPENALSEQTCRQLEAYVSDPEFRFSLPVEEQGTPFRMKVWAALRAIPVGQVRRYGELAAQLQTAARAVGGACRHNPIPLITPCHRIVSAHSLGGFAGQGEQDKEQNLIKVKRWLLSHEGVFFDSA